ncbi:uncharacterized protein BDR25DRAFT_355511 [Lindgomyces ingoldianus]|uniref:Uncharacterized protein n=1 Tax=Lindgomyces ingoldianus TaxID=673940 RepID=A0ACB6QU72_9PLEO|nr:uncharacterized protein BDR25DRAFT_355511 [Lindgomyces ingoldianus]KAF2470402.1 hypothetical protein BDR25DRAFT_355511 [Lindgomyces ingoldianus]
MAWHIILPSFICILPKYAYEERERRRSSGCVVFLLVELWPGRESRIECLLSSLAGVTALLRECLKVVSLGLHQYVLPMVKLGFQVNEVDTKGFSGISKEGQGSEFAPRLLCMQLVCLPMAAGFVVLNFSSLPFFCDSVKMGFDILRWRKIRSSSPDIRQDRGGSSGRNSNLKERGSNHSKGTGTKAYTRTTAIEMGASSLSFSEYPSNTSSKDPNSDPQSIHHFSHYLCPLQGYNISITNQRTTISRKSRNCIERSLSRIGVIPLIIAVLMLWRLSKKESQDHASEAVQANGASGGERQNKVEDVNHHAPQEYIQISLVYELYNESQAQGLLSANARTSVEIESYPFERLLRDHYRISEIQSYDYPSFFQSRVLVSDNLTTFFHSVFLCLSGIDLCRFYPTSKFHGRQLNIARAYPLLATYLNDCVRSLNPKSRTKKEEVLLQSIRALSRNNMFSSPVLADPNRTHPAQKAPGSAAAKRTPGSCSSPLLSFQIPFILLGKKTDVPKDIYNDAERETKPLGALHHMLRLSCPGVSIALWACEPRVEPEERLPHLPIKIGEEEVLQARRYTEWLKRQKEGWSRVEAAGGWVVRRAEETKKDIGPWHVGHWREGDGYLTEDEIRELEDGVFCFPVILQHVGVPVVNSVWRIEVEGELKKILETLEKYFNQHIEDFPFRIVVNEKCRLKIAVSTSEEQAGDQERWGLDMVVKLMLALTAWEKELVTTDTMTGVLEYWYLSRVLENRSVRDLRTFERNIRRSLLGKNRPFERAKERWFGNTEYDDDISKWKELWTVIDELREEEGGNSKLERLLKDMENSEKSGEYRLAVSFGVRQPSQRLISEKSEGGTTPHSKPNYLALESEGFDRESSLPLIIFQNHRSTLDYNELIAHLDLVSALIRFVQWTPYDVIRQAAKNFRAHLSALKEPTANSLVDFLEVLEARQSTREFYYEFTRSYGKLSPKKEYDIAQVSALERSPFGKIVRAIEKQRKDEREYMPLFIERYTKGGGFLRVPKSKLLSAKDALTRSLTPKFGEESERLERVKTDGKRGSDSAPPFQGEDSRGDFFSLQSTETDQVVSKSASPLKGEDGVRKGSKRY